MIGGDYLSGLEWKGGLKDITQNVELFVSLL